MNEEAFKDRDDGETTAPMILQYCVTFTRKRSARSGSTMRGESAAAINSTGLQKCLTPGNISSRY